MECSTEIESDAICDTRTSCATFMITLENDNVVVVVDAADNRVIA